MAFVTECNCVFGMNEKKNKIKIEIKRKYQHETDEQRKRPTEIKEIKTKRTILRRRCLWTWYDDNNTGRRDTHLDASQITIVSKNEKIKTV